MSPLLKILLADDELGILTLMESFLAGISELTIVGKTLTIKDTLQCFVETKPDIVILDIEFPDGSGIDLAKKLVTLDSDIDIVFVTAHPGFALDAFEIYSYDYILKPINENRVLRTLMQIKKEREILLRGPFPNLSPSKNQSQIAIRTAEEIILINQQDILFFERSNKKIKVHTQDRIYETLEPLYNLEANLGGDFFRSHKAYIVNLSNVEKIVSWNDNTYQIRFKKSNKEAYLSRRKVNELYKILPILG